MQANERDEGRMEPSFSTFRNKLQSNTECKKVLEIDQDQKLENLSLQNHTLEKENLMFKIRER